MSFSWVCTWSLREGPLEKRALLVSVSVGNEAAQVSLTPERRQR